MSLSEQLMTDLMAYADGELVGEAKLRIEQLISRDEEARRVVEATSMLGDAVRWAEEERALPRSATKIVDAVMKETSTLSMGTLDGLGESNVVRIRRAAAAGMVSLVFAAAAGWFLFFRAGPRAPVEQGMQATVAPSERGAHPQPTASEAEAVATGGGSELESSDSPVSVFFVSAGPESLSANATSVVVWLGDNGGSQ